MRSTLTRIWQRSRRRSVAGRLASGFAGELQSAGLTFAQWHDKLVARPRVYADLAETHVGWLRAEFPELAGSTVCAAADVLAHRFNLLGSGPYEPIDPDRPIDTGNYRPIDWRLDPVSGERFPHPFRHGEWDLATMRPGHADIKLPWELGRCQHLVVLAQAYRLTADERFVRELLRQICDFREANPLGVGIHWVCTMDVALRALAWAQCLAVLRGCRAVPLATWSSLYEALFEHGLFIAANLENKYEVTSNHFLSDLVGLYFLACVFEELESGRRWHKLCRDSLEKEIQTQVLADGADYESSLSYHRLVTELFLAAARLAQLSGRPLSAAYHQRLRRMVEFLIKVLRPDGLMPQVGDADDGRAHIFTRYGDWTRQDPRHLLGPAALLFQEPSWWAVAGPDAAWEAAWWFGTDEAALASIIALCGRQAAVQRFAAPANASARLPDCFELLGDAGLAVVRTSGFYLLVTNSRVGTGGFGNHKHNDQLSFECHIDGAPLIVDPGSYVYTSDPDARNLFRGTAYHNTLRIDEQEQNELRGEYLFRLFEAAHPEHLEFAIADGSAIYRGRHRGYARLAGAVTHERRFAAWPGQGVLTISDTLVGEGEHALAWHFHLAPGVEVVVAENGFFRLVAQQRVFQLAYPRQLQARIDAAWYSPGYGVRLPCQAIELRAIVQLRGTQQWHFALARHDALAGSQTRRLQAAGGEA
jgi:hypothetical protein